MKEKNINSIEDFFIYCKNEFEYGWIDKEGKRHKEFINGKIYSLQTPEELIKSKLGICWDMTELYRDYFKNMTNLKFETYYLLYDDGKGCPCHTILVYYKNHKVYWFEPMFPCKEQCGINEYNSIDVLINDFKNIWIKDAIENKLIPKNYSTENILIYKYDTLRYHINGYEIREHINNSELYNVM